MLSETEKESIKSPTREFSTARKGQRYAKLAQRSPLGKNAESYLRLINAQHPQGEPTAKPILKIIEQNGCTPTTQN